MYHFKCITQNKQRSAQIIVLLLALYCFDPREGGGVIEHSGRPLRVTAYSSSLSSMTSGGELEKRMGLVSDVGKADLMSSPWPVRAA